MKTMQYDIQIHWHELVSGRCSYGVLRYCLLERERKLLCVEVFMVLFRRFYWWLMQFALLFQELFSP